jgi:predicted DNA-binding antitoxin AbrB/MazE fold protein
MDRLEIDAVYEHGTLKLPRELPLQEGQRVKLTIEPTQSAVERLSGLIPWKGSWEDLEYLVESDDNSIWTVEE